MDKSEVESDGLLVVESEDGTTVTALIQENGEQLIVKSIEIIGTVGNFWEVKLVEFARDEGGKIIEEEKARTITGYLTEGFCLKIKMDPAKET